MQTHADKNPEQKHPSSKKSTATTQAASGGEKGFADNRPEAVSTKQLQQVADSSSQSKQLAQWQAAVPLVQRKANKTGLPDNLKAGVEQLSGLSMDDVRVHYNSGKPHQLQAHAYAQGTDIHVAPGQEQHLPHEAWHVAQQKQGRVQPTRQLKEQVNVNDDAGLEKEADLMGAKALQLKAADQPVASRPPGRQLFGTLVQLVNKKIGDPATGVVDRAHVVAEIGTANTLSWPTNPNGVAFSQNYGGSVARALNWGALGGEGTSGWTTRNYEPNEFHALANKAFAATRGLNAPALDNEPNKTLIAIRTFRGGGGAEMANKTLQDLQAVLLGVTNARANLFAANMLPNAMDAITEVRADPAEAHPGTLPTSKITFASGQRLYFKGRSGAVEDALVGVNGSAAHEISQLGAPQAGDETGEHAFLTEGNTHLTADVGAPAPHGPVSDEDATRAWLSAARTAALVSLTGTGDLHDSNVIDAAGATKHIIDAEFLLDATAWRMYEDAAQQNEISNFEVDNMAPQWVKDHTSQLSTIKKLQLSDEVALRFRALGLDNDGTLEQILAPIRALINNEVLLRVSPDPFNTAYWLNQISQFHNAPDKDAFVDQQWNNLQQVYPTDFLIDLMNARNVKARLKANFENGEVPLFHIGASTRTFYLDKDTLMGSIRQERSAENFLELTKAGMLHAYDHMVLTVRAAILDS